ncbi:hypothetical protein [Paenibacillus dendritiformis]|uniref:hypothetical protein n=1 Tax=Paenibacillus dendritiformis TaxID=130049 RepID=UPI00387E139F
MGISKKEQIAYIQQLLQYDLSKGGMADFNEYNQFLCDIVPELVQYLTPAGRDFLQQECVKIREQMIEFANQVKNEGF